MSIASIIIRRIGNRKGIYETPTGSIIRHIEAHNPSLRLRNAPRAAREGAGFVLIERGGIAYFAKPSYKVLNPFAGDGVGLQFVKGSNADPTGIYLTRDMEATDDERLSAIKAYLCIIGVPEADLTVLPATCWPHTYDRTPENIAALEGAGAVLFHE